MHLLRVIAVWTLCMASLPGCSGGSSEPSSGGGSPANSPSSLSVDSFEVNGTSSSLLSGTENIDAAEGGGVFSLSWQAGADTPYELHAMVSKNAVPEFGIDPRIMDVECRASNSCSYQGGISCQFDSQNIVQCENQPAVDLTSWFDSLPQDAYILFEVCAGNQCRGKAAPVQFR